LVFRHWPTMDGAAHLYNARLLLELVFNGGEGLQGYYSLNPEPVPNWTGHLVLMLGMLVGLPAFLAEKVLLLCIGIGLPLAFYSLVKKIRSEVPGPLSLLILPFVYTFLFGLGFYNFTLGLVFFLLTLRQWFSIREQPDFGKNILLFVGIALCYFSHLLSFVMLAISLLVLVLSDYFSSTDKVHRKQIFRNALAVLTLFIPFLALFAFFYLKRDGASGAQLSMQELVEILVGIRSLVIYNFGHEYGKTTLIYHVLMVLSVGAAFLFSKEEVRSKVFWSRLSWAILTLISLILLFVMPDSSSGGGYISQRISLFLFFFVLLWINENLYPKMLARAAAGLVVILHFMLVVQYIKVAATQNKEAGYMAEVAGHIKPGSVVLPIRSSWNWLDGHFSNYLGIDKPLTILENYEASTGYFPVLWNDERVPAFEIGYGASDCAYWKKGNAVVAQPDYIVFWGVKDPEACEAGLLETVQQHYELVYTSQEDHVKLYRNNAQ